MEKHAETPDDTTVFEIMPLLAKNKLVLEYDQACLVSQARRHNERLCSRRRFSLALAFGSSSRLLIAFRKMLSGAYTDDYYSTQHTESLLVQCSRVRLISKVLNHVIAKRLAFAAFDAPARLHAS